VTTPEPVARWIDVEVRIPPRRPRIEPGTYQAVSISLEKKTAFGRQTLELGFDCYAGDVGAGEAMLLGRVPYFVRLPGKNGLSPNSSLARLFYLLGISPRRHERVRLDILRGKVWLVEVADMKRDSQERPIGKDETYSHIVRVVSRLA